LEVIIIIIIIIIMQRLTRHVSVIRMTNRTRDYDLMALYKSVYYYYYYYYLRFHNKNSKIGFLTELLKNYWGRCVISMLAMSFVQTHITQ